MSALQDLYALIPAEGYILGHALPAVFAQYEAQRGAELLSASERDALDRFGRENAKVRVDAELLVGLMGQLLGAAEVGGEGTEESGRVVPGQGHQLTLADADTSLPDDVKAPFTPTNPSRDKPASTDPQTTSRHSRTPSTGGKPTITPASGIPRRRVQTTEAPPSSFSPGRGSNRRGSDPAASPRQAVPTSTRSASAMSNHSGGGGSTSKIARPRPPRTSTSSRHSTSPGAIFSGEVSSRRARPSSGHPADPPGSPELPALRSGVDAELSMLDETSFVRGSLEGDVSVDEGEGSARLGRIPTASTGSLGATYDALQGLRRENTELVKKKNELARQLQVIGAETEAQMADLQESLDGARAELATKRREEKESRTREAQLGTQICTLELEMQHLQQQLSTARDSHATQQRMLQDANGEADRLRDVVLGKEEDVVGLKGVIEGYEDEKRSWQDQIDTLQATNATLQTSLQAAQEAARTLERRKAENQELQQTIKRLSHELDVLRTQQVATGRHAREGTEAEPGSVASRGPGPRMSLGDELKSVFDAENEEQDKSMGGTVVRTVTYRTERVIHHRNKDSNDHKDDDADSEPEASFVEEIVREYTDAGVATDPEVPASPSMTSSAIQTDETHHGTLPPYSPRSDAEIASEALAHAHPELEVTEKIDLQRHGELAVEYAEMTMAIGVRCTVLEEKLQVKQDEAMRIGGGVMSKRQSSPSTKPDLSLGMWLYLCAILVAVSVGGYLFGSRRNYSRQLDILRNVLRDYTIPYSHLLLQEFAPRTSSMLMLGGGSKHVTGRSPI